MRQGSAWVHESTLPPEEKHRLLARLAAAVWCFPRSLARHVLSADEDAADYATDVRSNLRADLAEDLIAARHKPTRALYEMSCAINEFPLSDWRRVAMDSAATTLCDAMGSSERIFTSPVPRFYTRHTARFLEVWLLLMPLTLYSSFDYTWNHWFMIPATMVISFFLLGTLRPAAMLRNWIRVGVDWRKLTNVHRRPSAAVAATFISCLAKISGIEELGIQLEEPFRFVD
jgi:ion channel-forming bestrophin family protein